MPVKEKVKPISTPNFSVIDTGAALDDFVERTQDVSVLGIDLEADSMHHFKERVCLLQIASVQACVLVDPLALETLSPLAPLFNRADIKKVFHGADYDVRSLYRDFQFEIEGLFDTEIACRFLGMPETSLDAVLQKKFGCRLDKRYQRKDWSKRPLPPEMLAYAAADVMYLIPLAEMLESELADCGRLDWVTEECGRLQQVRPPVFDDRPLFVRFKGAGRLPPRDLAVLEALLQVRRKAAEAADRPLFKVIGNQVLLKIALEKPASVEALKSLNVLSTKQFARFARPLATAVRSALALSPERLPKFPRKKPLKLPPQLPDRVKALKRWRAEVVRRTGLEEALICPRALLTAIARKYPKDLESLKAVEGIRGWQVRNFGADILKALEKTN